MRDFLGDYNSSSSAYLSGSVTYLGPSKRFFQPEEVLYDFQKRSWRRGGMCRDAQPLELSFPMDPPSLD